MDQVSKLTHLIEQCTDAAACPLGILLDERHNIESVLGNATFYGYATLFAGTPVADVLPFTRGLIEPIHLTLPFARTPNGRHANVQIALSGSSRHILLTDVTETRVLESSAHAHAAAAAQVANHEQWLLHGLQTELDWFREIFDKAAVGMSIVGPGQILLRANRALCDMLGYDEAEIIGGTYAKFTHPDDLAANVDLTQRFYDQKTRHYVIEKRYMRKDGRVIWAQVTASSVRYPGRDSEVIFAVVQEITARKQVEQTLSRREQRLRAMREAVPGCITINRPDGTIEDVNPGGLALFEAAGAGEMVGRRVQDFVKASSLEGFRDYSRRVLADQGGSHEFEAVTLKGRSVWLETRGVKLLEDDGRSPALLAATHDITERKHNEAVLRRQLAAMEGAMDGMALFDLDANFAYLNNAKVRLFGYDDASELIGKSWKACYSPHEVRRFEQSVLPQLIRDGQWKGEAIGLRRDGSEFDEELSLSLAQDGSMVCVSRDITQRKREQQALVDSLLEKEALLQEVHHRVKNNLQVVSSLLNLQSGQMHDEAARQMIRDSQTRLQAMALIHETLYRSGDISHVDFAEYAGNLAQHLAHANDLRSRGIVLVTKFAPAQMSVDTAISCGLILNELVANCLKHAFPAQQPGKIRLTLARKSGNTLVLSVTDNGVGLPANPDPNARRTLGMRIVNALASQLSGTFELKNARRGAIARLTFELSGNA